MGFGSKGNAAKTGRVSGKKQNKSNVPKEAPVKGGRLNGFVPSTGEDIKSYTRNAKKAARLKKRDEKRARLKQRKHGVRPRTPSAMREAFDQGLEIRVYQPQLFEKVIEYCKEQKIKPPAYKEYLKQKDADAEFFFGIQKMLAAFTWFSFRRSLPWVPITAWRLANGTRHSSSRGA
jgi:hypothetical protein